MFKFIRKVRYFIYLYFLLNFCFPTLMPKYSEIKRNVSTAISTVVNVFDAGEETEESTEKNNDLTIQNLYE